MIQLYRNLLIVLMNTFILNPLYRVISLIPVFLIFVIHDKHESPYKHPYLNILQVLSSSCLLVLTVCNIPPSMSFATQLDVIPFMNIVVPLLKYTELALYIVMPGSLILWKIKGWWSAKKRMNDSQVTRRERCLSDSSF